MEAVICRSFVYTEQPLNLREDILNRQDGRNAQQEQKKINGFTGDSVFNYVPVSLCQTMFQLIICMAFCWELLRNYSFCGVMINHMTWIVTLAKKSEIDDAIIVIRPPYVIHRSPRKPVQHNAPLESVRVEIMVAILFIAVSQRQTAKCLFETSEPTCGSNILAAWGRNFK